MVSKIQERMRYVCLRYGALDGPCEHTLQIEWDAHVTRDRGLRLIIASVHCGRNFVAWRVRPRPASHLPAVRSRTRVPLPGGGSGTRLPPPGGAPGRRARRRPPRALGDVIFSGGL